MLRLFPALAALLAFCAETVCAAWTVAEKADLGTLPAGAQVRKWTFRNGEQSAVLTAVIFSENDYRVAVEDNPSASGRLEDSAPRAKAEAGINGGYFHQDMTPLGLVIIDGKTRHSFEKAKLLSGILVQHAKSLRLIRSENHNQDTNTIAAIQAGPWLVDKGRAVAGLNAVKRARRTIVATDGKGKWALISLSPVTLADAAGVLRAAPLFGENSAANALNLDGGSSTALWADLRPNPLSIPEFGAVRNYVVIIPRKP